MSCCCICLGPAMPVIAGADIVCFLFEQFAQFSFSTNTSYHMSRCCVSSVCRIQFLAPMPVITEVDRCVPKEDSWKQVNTISRSQKWDNEENTNGKIVFRTTTKSYWMKDLSAFSLCPKSCLYQCVYLCW